MKKILLAVATAILVIAGLVLIIRKPMIEGADGIKVEDKDKLKKHRIIGAVLLVVGIGAGFFAYRMHAGKDTEGGITATEAMESLPEFYF